MLRYETQSPIVSRSRIVQVVKRVRATRVGAVRSRTLSVVAVASTSAQRGPENWFALAWRKLVRAA